MCSRLHSVPVLILLLATPSSGLDAAARRPSVDTSQPAAAAAPQAKPSRAAARSPKKARPSTKPARAGTSKASAPCNTPAPAVAEAKKPVPVPTDPLAPAVAPCPGTTH
jgi:hypothetical protein